MAQMDIYSKNYRRLEALGLLNVKEHAKIVNSPWMDLNVDVLSDNEDTKIIAIAHNFIQNGDVMADPDMGIAIYKKQGQAEALHYQLDALGVFRKVYFDTEDGKRMVNLTEKKDQNAFLQTWLVNLKNQGFKYAEA